MRVLQVAYGVAFRTVTLLRTNPSIYVAPTLFPLVFFVAFAGGLAQVEEVPGFDYAPGYAAFQFVFVLLQSAAFGGVFTGLAVARDFESGFSKRLLLASPARVGIVLGYGAAAIIRWSVTATLLTILALLFGMEIGGGAVDVFSLYFLALLVNVCGYMWSAGIAMRFRSLQAGPMMQLPVFLVLFFAPVYVPLALLDGWLEAVARVNPATLLLETGRGLVAGDADDVLIAFAVAITLVGGFLWWAVRGLRSAEAAG